MATVKAASFWRAQLTIFAVLFTGYASYNYNRRSFSFAIPSLLTNGLLHKSSAGTISSCQNIAHAVSKFAAGVLSDKISAKWLFFSGLLLSGGTTILFSYGSTVPIFASLWFLNGFAQGAGWPACVKLLKKWFSPEQFGTFWSGLSAASNVSGSICPILAAWIIAHFDWRMSLIGSGGVAVACAVCAMLFLKESPKDVGFEQDFSLTQKKDNGCHKEKSSKSDPFNWKDLLHSPLLRLVSVGYFVVFSCRTSVTDWGQMYLIEDLGQSPFIGSSFVSAVETGGFFGGIAAGYITDWLMKRTNRGRGNPRMFAAIWFMAGIAINMFLLTNFATNSSSQLFLSFVGFGLGACIFACIAIFGIVASESFPAHLSGTAHAIAALTGNVGAILSGLPCSYVAQVYSWRAIFVIMETLATCATFLLITCRTISPFPESKAKLQ